MLQCEEDGGESGLSGILFVCLFVVVVFFKYKIGMHQRERKS